MYNLGLLNEAIYSTSKNIAVLKEAKECYEKAAKNQHYESLKRSMVLVKSEASSSITADSWYQQGRKFDPNYVTIIEATDRQAAKGLKSDYLKAQACYELAIGGCCNPKF